MSRQPHARRVDAGSAFDLRRRRFAATAAIGMCLGWPLRGLAGAAVARWHGSRAMMGTRVDIVLESRDASLPALALERAFDDMQRLVDQMSHYRVTSSVGAINLAAGIQPVAVPAELMQVLQAARAVSGRSDGAFDVTIGSVGRWHFDPDHPRMPSAAEIARHLPVVDHRHLVLDEAAGTAFLTRPGMRIDVGGIAKLYILDAGMRSLRRSGVEQALINGGGDVVVIGRQDHRPWRIGVRDPRRPRAVLGVLELRHGVVASSGDYERCFVRDGRRYHHVIDPRTGYPAQGPHGVTLVADTFDAVNGLGAAVMVAGPRAGRGLIAQARGVDALVVGLDHGLWMTPGMARRLQPASANGLPLTSG